MGDEKIHFRDGEHDPDGPFFGGTPLEVDDGEPINVENTDEILGDALANEWADKWVAGTHVSSQ